MSNTSMPKPHAIVFPYPYQGHITPAINLAGKLASHGFTVTYVLPEFIHRTISKAHGHEATAGLDIRYATISDGFSPEFDRDANLTEYWESMISDFPALVDEHVGRVKKTGDQAAGYFLVADSLYTWAAEIAAKHDLVNVSLWTEPAVVFSICYHLDLLKENGHFPCQGGDYNHMITYIPGVESIRTKDLMSYILNPNVVPVVTKIVITAFEHVKKADFILCNTVQELEPNAVSALNEHQPTFAIGPINFFTETCPRKSLRAESDCSGWLSSKPPRSVLYVSFGSIAQINKQEMIEIAHGLVQSGVNFLWILRTDDVAGLFPVGFLDDMAGRGLVVPWCNQEEVLSSRAIGGFLTHCGWNSILESVWNGVPMICHPFFVDQPTNKKMVVEDWRVGIGLCDERGRVTKEEVSRKIGGLMKGEKSIELREEIKRVSMISRGALESGGSSQRNFDLFIGDLKSRLSTKMSSISCNDSSIISSGPN